MSKFNKSTNILKFHVKNNYIIIELKHIDR